jgi:hypothetical protein
LAQSTDSSSVPLALGSIWICRLTIVTTSNSRHSQRQLIRSAISFYICRIDTPQDWSLPRRTTQL